MTTAKIGHSLVLFHSPLFFVLCVGGCGLSVIRIVVASSRFGCVLWFRVVLAN